MDKKNGRPNSFQMNFCSAGTNFDNFGQNHGILRSNNGGEGHGGQELRESLIKQPTGC